MGTFLLFRFRLLRKQFHELHIDVNGRILGLGGTLESCHKKSRQDPTFVARYIVPNEYDQVDAFKATGRRTTSFMWQNLVNQQHVCTMHTKITCNEYRYSS